MTTQDSRKKPEQVTIKKYANRRLYNTATSTYVTLDSLARMIRDGVDFNVYDAKTGEDITRSVLTQIIMEAENGGQSLLPTPFLRQLISFYGGNMDGVLGRYLEQSMQAFSQNKDKVRDMLKTVSGGLFPVPRLDEMGKQNLALFDRTLRMFSPFSEDAEESPTQTAVKRMRAESERSLEELQGQLNRLQSQIGEILGKKR
jgi:polyhydroxyalkanoate synthesis repressor PhaR